MEPQPNVRAHSPAEIVRGAHYLIPPASPAGHAAVLMVPPENRASSSTQPIRLTLPDGFTPLPEQGVTESGLPRRILCNADGAVMALVPAGVFTLGTNTGPPESRPEHPVYVSAFYIDVQEVTLARYLKFMDDNKNSKKPQATPDLPKNAGEPLDYPALGVTFRDASNYARFYNKSLPTEAEWEKAGRGTDGGIYPWGNGRPLWHPQRSLGMMSPVGTFSADLSPYGVVDLSGNAREWVSDWYLPDLFQQRAAQAGSVVRDPQGPNRPPESLEHVVKGGGPRGWELFYRSPGSTRNAIPDVGFRCVLRVTSGMLAGE